MSQKNRTNMLIDITSNIYNNIVNFITGNNAQQRFVNLLDSAPNILSDKDQANGYVGTGSDNEMLSAYYCENIAAVDLFNKADIAILVPRKWYMVNNANSGTKKILVQAQTINTLYGGGFDATTGEGGTYNINTGVFTAVGSSTSGLIETIAKVDFDALIAANGLIVGKWYLVTAAYTSTVFAATWNVLCIADSVNTVDSHAFVISPVSAPAPCEYDPITPTVKVGSVYGIFITPTIADTWSSLSFQEVFPQSIVTVDALGGGQYIELKVSSDPATLTLTNALNTTTGQYGTYDPSTDTFYPYSDTYTPTLTPDGAVVTAVSAPSIYASHSSDGFTLDLMIQFTASVDFSAGTDGTVDYTLPFGTLATSRGVICAKMVGTTNPNGAIFWRRKKRNN